ncbi:MAG: hypothetical protein ANABAC_2249 [Anaerolineae bacterium]|nr:MAG: hypothetical protein ANABAC_2249 [Anaerolineae bacterium]
MTLSENLTSTVYFSNVILTQIVGQKLIFVHQPACREDSFL